MTARPYLTALPPILGSKRRLVPVIFAALATVLPQASWSSATFIDPFSGGGSVALAAKARGFRVLAGDIAARAHIVARAFIANSAVRLSPLDIAFMLSRPEEPYQRVAEEQLSPSVFRLDQAKTIDALLYRAALLPEPKQALAMVLVIRTILRLQPMGVLDATDAPAANEGDFDRISSGRLPHYLRAGRRLTPASLQRMAESVNLGVLPGRGEAHQLDVFDFLARARGDVVYLDTPYPGTTSYERAYEALDLLLEGHALPRSAFSSTHPPLAELLAATAHVPVLVLSYGNAVVSADELEEMVSASGRKIVHRIEVPYRHLAPLATASKNATNRELLIVASHD